MMELVGKWKQGPNLTFDTTEHLLVTDSHQEASLFNASFTTVVLLLATLIGAPLNAATVLMFIRRKKLQTLVNFILLLDGLSHVGLCFLCVPIQLGAVWLYPRYLPARCWFVLLLLQQVVGNLANLLGLAFAVSIAILRYRRVCWRKKDEFSRTSALKWSVTSGTIPTGFVALQTSFMLLSSADPPVIPVEGIYGLKLVLIFFAILAVFFCYVRVSHRVWSSGAEPGVMGKEKLKKSKSVHMRATMHSCIQIVLIVATLCPYLYGEMMEVVDYHYHPAPPDLPQNNGSFSVSPSFSSSTYHSTRSDDDRLWSITVNYILLILGSPLAYVASCQIFREYLWEFFTCHSPAERQHNHQYARGMKAPEFKSRRCLAAGKPLETRIPSLHAILTIEKSVEMGQAEEEQGTQNPEGMIKQSQGSLPFGMGATIMTAASDSPSSNSWDSTKTSPQQLSSSSLTMSAASSSSQAAATGILYAVTRKLPAAAYSRSIAVVCSSKNNRLSTVPWETCAYAASRREDLVHECGHRV